MLRLLVICALYVLVCRAEDDNGAVFGSPERREETALMKTLLKRLLENKKTAGDQVCPTEKPFCVENGCYFAIEDLGQPMYGYVDYYPDDAEQLVVKLEVFGTGDLDATVLLDEADYFETWMLPYTSSDTFKFGGKTYELNIGLIDPSGDNLVVEDFCFVEV